MNDIELLNSKKELLKPLLYNIELILDGKKMKGEHRKDEFQKIFSCLIQGLDIVNNYERRKFGVSDESWDSSLSCLDKALGKNNENN